MFQSLSKLIPRLAVVLLAASCGGGGNDSPSGGCERVSAGTSSVTVQNNLATGVEAFFPQFSFGADMAAGECNVVGLEYSAATLNVRLELTQCNNSAGDTNCGGREFGPTRVQTFPLPRGASHTITVTPAIFN